MKNLLPGFVNARWLIVDDQEISRVSAENIMRRAGAATECACNGVEALSLLQKCSFQGILMDGKMQIMDGYQTTAHIRRRELETGADRLVIILVTADPDHASRALGAGMDASIQKPIDATELFEAIARARR